MQIEQLLPSLIDHDGQRYVRDDGATAIVVSMARGIVWFRRHEEGELMRVSQAAFARRYRKAVG